MTISSTSVTLNSVGATAQLSATVKDQNGASMAGKAITWATSEATVATVSSTGLVTAASPGTTQITATHQSLSATASTIVQDGQSPEVTMFYFDDLEVTFQPGVLELYGPTKIGVAVQDDYQLKKITVYLHKDGVDIPLSTDETLSGNTAVYNFNWNSYENAAVGGVDTIWAKVWDVSGHEGIGAQEIVIMNQPMLTVNNLLKLPVTVKFWDQNDVQYNDYVYTIPVGGPTSWRTAFLSTDSIQMSWQVQREQLNQNYSYLAGVDLKASFSAVNMTTDKTYEIDNVIGSATYYMPRWSNPESSTSEASPYVDINLTSEINICWVLSGYKCAVAPGADRQDYGYYKLETTSRAGWKERSGIGNYYNSARWYTYSTIVDYIADGSGTFDFNVSFGGSEEVSSSPLPGIAGHMSFDSPNGSNPRRIGGAMTDDRPGIPNTQSTLTESLYGDRISRLNES